MTAALLARTALLPAEPFVRLDGVRLSYAGTHGEVVALDGVTLDVAAGEIVAVVGRSGSGKSALLRVVEGREAPSAGQVYVGNGGGRPRVGVVARHGSLAADKTLAESLAAPLIALEVPAEDVRDEVERALELAGLVSARDRRPASLSDGERRRAVFARALCAAPDLLLLDEPTAGLDPESAKVLLAAVARACAEGGATALLASHDMAAVAAVAQRVALLDAGRIVEEGPTAQVIARPAYPLTRAFAAAVSGAELPSFLVSKLEPTPRQGGKALLRLAFEGEAATRPVLTQVARELGFDLGIVAGSLGAIGGEPFGVLIVAAPSDEPYYTAAVERLEDAGLGVEALGFVE